MRKLFFRSLTFKRFLLLLCGVYLCMVLLFHSRLTGNQPMKTGRYDGTEAATTLSRFTQNPDVFNASIAELHGWVDSYYNVKKLARDIHRLEKMVDAVKNELIVMTPGPRDNASEGGGVMGSCIRPTQEVENNKFHELQRGVYVYSGFLDDRKNVTFVRFITLVAKDQRNVFTMLCLFGDGTQIAALSYEMCENHNKQYGGYIYSCPVTSGQVCPVKIKTIAGHRLITVPISPVAMVKKPYKFGVCIPPLFGEISINIFVEFLELTMLLGAEQFYFYDFAITPEMSEVLKHYRDRKLVTLIPWKLPKEVNEKAIWYHGQLLAHNDCLYRAMSTSTFMAINDVDEFIIPHTQAKTWLDFVPGLLGDEHCGLAFPSAFYDPGLGGGHPSGLLTMSHTQRSELFSHVRTKVLVQPRRVFEVGIHHISKQNEERWTARKVHPDVAYLHHYRKCVANYGMKCKTTMEDKTVFKYFDVLQAKVYQSLTFLDAQRNLTVEKNTRQIRRP